jgi:uncharacterized phage-like protein YoqJ
MIVSITGHRPEDLPNQEWVRENLKRVIAENNVELLIQGMAAGVDLMSAEICMEVGTPFVCAKPWAGHTPRNADAQLYRKAVENAAEVVNVNPATEYIGAYVYHNRNQYMVDRADTVIAVWTGKKTGGTAACVRYAKSKNKRIIQINPLTMEVTVSKDDTLFDF